MTTFSDTRDAGNVLLTSSDQDMDLAQRLDSATTANADLSAQFEYLKKKYEGIQDELQTALSSQDKLEKQCFQADSELEAAKQRESDGKRKIRELESKLSNELKEFELEKTNFSQREEQLHDKIKGLRASQHQRLSVPTSPVSNNSRLRSISVSFSPPAYVSSIPETLSDSAEEDNNTETNLAHEAKVANRTVRQQLKEINDLKADVKQLKEQLVSQTTLDSLRVNQIDQLNKQVEQLNITNSGQMEEISSYQLLLEERTLRGQFSLGHRSSSYNMSYNGSPAGGYNLSSELSQAMSGSDSHDNTDDNTETNGNADDAASKQLREELQQVKDENKALALYISKILGKIMSNPVLAEAITHNGDSKKNNDEAPVGKKVPAPLKETLAVDDLKRNDTKSRFAGFLSPTFNIPGLSSPAHPPTETAPQPSSRVSFDVSSVSSLRKPPPLNRNSVDSSRADIIALDRNSGQSSQRSRRAKSMSVSNVASHGSSDGQNSTGRGSGGGAFSLRSAFKKMAGPWKSSTPSPIKTISENPTSTS